VANSKQKVGGGGKKKVGGGQWHDGKKLGDKRVVEGPIQSPREFQSPWSHQDKDRGGGGITRSCGHPHPQHPNPPKMKVSGGSGDVELK